MHKKSWHNSARNQKYLWYLLLQSVVLIIYHGCVLVQLLVGLAAGEADRRALAVPWMLDLEHMPETELVQQKGLCFVSALSSSRRGECRSQGNVSKVAHEMSKT